MIYIIGFIAMWIYNAITCNTVEDLIATLIGGGLFFIIILLADIKKAIEKKEKPNG
jgi:hypothetical protein